MRYDGTTLRDGEHDLIVYKVNKGKRSPWCFLPNEHCVLVLLSVPVYLPGQPTHAGVTAAIIKASLW